MVEYPEIIMPEATKRVWSRCNLLNEIKPNISVAECPCKYTFKSVWIGENQQ